jgi:ribonuclease HII
MFPTLALEASLLERHSLVIGLDEVGRGALAGRVAVGACVVSGDQLGAAPSKIQDSKLVPAPRRMGLATEIHNWSTAAVGFAEVAEIEALGISAALKLAAQRAIDELASGVAAKPPIDLSDAAVLLDGSANWLGDYYRGALVSTRVKADRDCVSVAAASLVAKVARDAEMTRLHDDHPFFGWQSNMGYSSAGHIAALREYGPCEHHRLSWLGKILPERTQLF